MFLLFISTIIQSWKHQSLYAAQRSANMALSRQLTGRFLVIRMFPFPIISPDARKPAVSHDLLLATDYFINSFLIQLLDSWEKRIIYIPGLIDSQLKTQLLSSSNFETICSPLIV